MARQGGGPRWATARRICRQVVAFMVFALLVGVGFVLIARYPLPHARDRPDTPMPPAASPSDRPAVPEREAERGVEREAERGVGGRDG